MKKEPTTKRSGIEREVIILEAVTELIDSIVNPKILLFIEGDPNSEVQFNSYAHQKLFCIYLVDFLSCTDGRSPIGKISYLEGLREIISSPNFNENNSIQNLTVATQKLGDWLEQEVEVDSVRLMPIDKETIIKVKRLSFLKMTGNITKHNYLRSVGVAKELREILLVSGIHIDIDQALLVLADFYDRFTDIMGYHASTITELLNNLRWGIFEYLQPELNRSMIRVDERPPTYRYKYPTEIKSEFAKNCYWELMNEVLKKPYLRKFQVTKWLKLRY